MRLNDLNELIVALSDQFKSSINERKTSRFPAGKNKKQKDGSYEVTFDDGKSEIGVWRRMFNKNVFVGVDGELMGVPDKVPEKYVGGTARRARVISSPYVSETDASLMGQMRQARKALASETKQQLHEITPKDIQKVPHLDKAFKKKFGNDYIKTATFRDQAVFKMGPEGVVHDLLQIREEAKKTGGSEEKLVSDYFDNLKKAAGSSLDTRIELRRMFGLKSVSDVVEAIEIIKKEFTGTEKKGPSIMKALGKAKRVGKAAILKAIAAAGSLGVLGLLAKILPDLNKKLESSQTKKADELGVKQWSQHAKSKSMDKIIESAIADISKQKGGLSWRRRGVIIASNWNEGKEGSDHPSLHELSAYLQTGGKEVNALIKKMVGFKPTPTVLKGLIKEVRIAALALESDNPAVNGDNMLHQRQESWQSEKTYPKRLKKEGFESKYIESSVKLDNTFDQLNEDKYQIDPNGTDDERNAARMRRSIRGSKLMEKLLETMTADADAAKKKGRKTLIPHPYEEIGEMSVKTRSAINTGIIRLGKIAHPDFMGPASRKDGKDSFTVKVLPEGGRAFFSPNEKGGGINIGKNDHFSVVMHEMGHYAETLNGRLADASTHFLDLRIKPTDRAKSLSMFHDGYDSHEVTREDAFAQPYVGKVYPRHRSCEALAVGIQNFADPRLMMKLWDEDRSLFTFAYAALQGQFGFRE